MERDRDRDRAYLGGRDNYDYTHLQASASPIHSAVSSEHILSKLSFPEGSKTFAKDFPAPQGDNAYAFPASGGGVPLEASLTGTASAGHPLSFPPSLPQAPSYAPPAALPSVGAPAQVASSLSAHPVLSSLRCAAAQDAANGDVGATLQTLLSLVQLLNPQQQQQQQPPAQQAYQSTQHPAPYPQQQYPPHYGA